MFAEERETVILECLHRDGKVRVEELSRELGVSLPTIRADLSRLEERGVLRRTHGGALRLEETRYEPPYAERAILYRDYKQQIAMSAVERVRTGDSVLLDAGTTCFEIALLLCKKSNLTILTNAPASAEMLAATGRHEVVLIGGVFQAHRKALMGPLACRFLEPVQCDVAFIGVNGVHPSAGFTASDFDAAQMKLAMHQHARETVVVADTSKLGQVAFALIGALNIADILITDARISSTECRVLEQAGLDVVVASENGAGVDEAVEHPS